jgi:hypothetical protein
MKYLSSIFLNRLQKVSQRPEGENLRIAPPREQNHVGEMGHISVTGTSAKNILVKIAVSEIIKGHEICCINEHQT